MSTVHAYAAFNTTEPLKPHQIKRREVGDLDVQIDILFCGVCHSDLHFVKGDWGPANYPIVPGHEIVGRVERVGKRVTRHKIGDLVGVGCLVDSCRTCFSCRQDLEQFCETGATMTYGSPDKVLGGVTQGGYATQSVVTQDFVVKIPERLSPEKAAPLLCAGITTYSPLRHWKVRKGQHVAVAGLGGLGHMGVKIAASLGAEVTVLSTSENKRTDALNLGAHNFIVTKDSSQMSKAAKSFDFILNTISAGHDYNAYLSTLKRDGTMVIVGLPPPQPVAGFALVGARRSLAGSLIGGIAETQEMLNYCSEHSLGAEVEVIPMEQINAAYNRLLKNDVHYRFVIDMKSLK
jgi:alcohol dehydrogenase (NADP+)